MFFLDPKTDIAFKKLFSDNTHKNIIISFLNSILDRKADEIIVDIVINDPHNLPETLESKFSIVDVRCTDQANRHYIVEMQVIRKIDYLQRAQYYNSLALSRQLKSKGAYEKLEPVIFVGILDFKVFNNPHYISHHLILDQKTHHQELKHLEFHFVELKKFNKELQELTTLSDKWIYFLKHAGDMETIPNALKNPDMEDAFHILNQTTWSRESLELYDRYVDVMRSEKSLLSTGRAEGRAEGLIEGKLEASITIAKQLLDVLDVETVAKKTDLTLEIVKKLKSKMK